MAFRFGVAGSNIMNCSDKGPDGARLARSVGQSVFGADAAGYHFSRLGYPQQLYDSVFARTGRSSGHSVLEVGAGTGRATRDLLARGPRCLVAIEPDPRLVAFLRSVEKEDGAALTIENKRFEEVELTPESFDLAVAAASFHWLEPIPALARMRAALEPRGTLALWWNVYRAGGIGDPFADAVIPLLKNIALPPSEGDKTHISLDEAYHRRILAECGFENVEYLLFRRERLLDAAGVRALYSGYSFVRELEAGARERLLGQILELVERRFDGWVPNVVLTPLYVATRGS